MENKNKNDYTFRQIYDAIDQIRKVSNENNLILVVDTKMPLKIFNEKKELLEKFESNEIYKIIFYSKMLSSIVKDSDLVKKLLNAKPKGNVFCKNCKVELQEIDFEIIKSLNKNLKKIEFCKMCIFDPQNNKNN